MISCLLSISASDKLKGIKYSVPPLAETLPPGIWKMSLAILKKPAGANSWEKRSIQSRTLWAFPAFAAAMPAGLAGDMWIYGHGFWPNYKSFGSANSPSASPLPTTSNIPLWFESGVLQQSNIAKTLVVLYSFWMMNLSLSSIGYKASLAMLEFKQLNCIDLWATPWPPKYTKTYKGVLFYMCSICLRRIVL